MYSIHNEEKSLVAETFITALKKKNLQTYHFSIKKCVYL